MKSFDSDKSLIRAGLTRLALAVALSGAAACSSGAGGGSDSVGNPIGTGGSAGVAMGAAGMVQPMAGATAVGGASGATAAGASGAAAAGAAGMVVSGGGGNMGNSGAGGMAGAAAGAGGDVSVAGSTAGSGGAEETAGAGGMPGEGGCLDGITNYQEAGPFKFMLKTAGQVNIWVPMVPAGCKVPVIHLANGTGASCASYMPIHERLASHGFLETCYEDPNTGAGTQGVMAIDTAISMYPDLADATKIGSTGHSQGGQAAFTVLSLAEDKWGDGVTYAGLAMEPASGFGTQPAGGWQTLYGKINSPMFMFSGTADILVSEGWVNQAFNAMADTTETYWWSANGATHIPVPNEPTMQVAVAWFRWKLLGDKAACEFFKKMPDGDGWDSRMEKNAKDCM